MSRTGHSLTPIEKDVKILDFRQIFSSKCQGSNTSIVTKGSHIITRVFKGAPEVLIRTASLMPVKHTTAHIYFGW